MTIFESIAIVIILYIAVPLWIYIIMSVILHAWLSANRYHMKELLKLSRTFPEEEKDGKEVFQKVKKGLH